MARRAPLRHPDPHTRLVNLKPITREGIPAALQKAERYRLLNESSAAESICLDVLAIDPKNQEALVSLLLAITDQFAEEAPVADPAQSQAPPRRCRASTARGRQCRLFAQPGSATCAVHARQELSAADRARPVRYGRAAAVWRVTRSVQVVAEDLGS